MRHLRTLLPAATAAAATAALAPAGAIAHTATPAPATSTPTAKTKTTTKTTTTSTAARSSRQQIKLRFRAIAGDQDVSCGTPITGLGTTGASAQLQDLRFFVSGVQLRRTGTNRWTSLRVDRTTAYRVAGTKQGATLIDLENAAGACAKVGTASTNATVLGSVPKGRYSGVRLTLGVPEAINHGDTVGAKGPLGLTAMAWSWQAGRKFTKIELVDPAGAAGAWTSKAFMVHLGSTGCTGNPATGETVACKAENRADVTFKRFDLTREVVGVDLAALLAGVDVTRNGGGAPGCMSGPTDPECPAIFKAAGLDPLTGKPAAGQTLLRAIKR